jgi:hypothetical protein
MELNVEGTAHYPLIMMIRPGHQLQVSFDYHPDHFSALAMESLSQAFLQVLAAYVADPDLPISSIAMLPGQERRQISESQTLAGHSAKPNPKPNGQASSELQDAQPTSLVEKLLIDIWKEILEVANVGALDNFFDLGGHSLGALRIITRVNDYFRIELSVRLILEHPVLREFAHELLSASGRTPEEMEKIAKIGLMVRKMTPEQRKAALSVQ